MHHQPYNQLLTAATASTRMGYRGTRSLPPCVVGFFHIDGSNSLSDPRRWHGSRLFIGGILLWLNAFP